MDYVAYVLVGPLLLIGVGAGGLLAFLVPVILPRFKRPFAAAWAVSSLFMGSAMFLEHVGKDHGSFAGGLAWAAGTSAGLAVLLPLMWWRVHMWDILAAQQERRRQDDLNSRYRPVDFSE